MNLRIYKICLLSMLFLVLPIFVVAEDMATTCQQISSADNSCQNVSAAECRALLEKCASYYDEQSAQIAQDLTKTKQQKDTLQSQVTSLKKKPMNANQLSNALNLDYKTIQHHIRILLDNQVISAVNRGKYGAVYFISDEMDRLWNDFQSIWKQFGKK